MSVWRDHISGGSGVGPSIKGTGIEVETILRLVGEGWSADGIIERFPALTLEDIRACSAYAADVLLHAELDLCDEEARDERNFVSNDEVWKKVEKEFGPFGSGDGTDES